jgi:hypothetical protein
VNVVVNQTSFTNGSLGKVDDVWKSRHRWSIIGAGRADLQLPISKKFRSSNPSIVASFTTFQCANLVVRSNIVILKEQRWR